MDGAEGHGRRRNRHGEKGKSLFFPLGPPASLPAALISPALFSQPPSRPPGEEGEGATALLSSQDSHISARPGGAKAWSLALQRQEDVPL